MGAWMGGFQADDDQYREFPYVLGVIEADLGECGGILLQYTVRATILRGFPVDLTEAALQLSVAEDQEVPRADSCVRWAPV